MKPILYAVAAMVLYAVVNTVIDVKLKSRVSTVQMLLVLYAICMGITGTVYALQKSKGTAMGPFPTGTLLVLCVLSAILYFCADYLYVESYNKGGNVVMVMTTIALSPVIGSLLKFAWTGHKITGYHALGIGLALMAVVAIGLGELSAQKDKKETVTAVASKK
jgi:drug/metabolite transporter (DMT)-like permease